MTNYEYIISKLTIETTARIIVDMTDKNCELCPDSTLCKVCPFLNTKSTIKWLSEKRYE